MGMVESVTVRERTGKRARGGCPGGALSIRECIFKLRLTSDMGFLLKVLDNGCVQCAVGKD